MSDGRTGRPSAETAVTRRHLRRLWALPGTQLGVVAWPPARRDRLFASWHYWWQAHLLDCLVDAELGTRSQTAVTRFVVKSAHTGCAMSGHG